MRKPNVLFWMLLIPVFSIAQNPHLLEDVNEKDFFGMPSYSSARRFLQSNSPYSNLMNNDRVDVGSDLLVGLDNEDFWQ